jgi:hypothetical protein
MRKTGLDQPVHLRWVRYLACFHGREERNDLVRIEEFADPVRELLTWNWLPADCGSMRRLAPTAKRKSYEPPRGSAFR